MNLIGFIFCVVNGKLGYERSLNSFSVASGLNIILISADDLKDMKPFALWRDYYSTGNFITLRHILI